MALTALSANAKDIRTAQHGVELQHRHFSFIAGVLADVRPDGTNSADLATWEMTVSHFASACARSNPRFNRGRFLAACGTHK